MLRTPGAGKPSTSNNAALSVFLRVRPPGVPDADIDRLTGRRTYQILEDKATLRTFPPLSAGHSRTINRQVGGGVWGGAVRRCGAGDCESYFFYSRSSFRVACFHLAGAGAAVVDVFTQ